MGTADAITVARIAANVNSVVSTVATVFDWVNGTVKSNAIRSASTGS